MRDAAITLCRERLRQYGERFTYQPETHDYPYHFARTVFTFPPLPHPATPEDVRRGLAIFTLNDPAAHIVAMPPYPLMAQWLALKKYPRDEQRFDAASGKSQVVTGYEQSGQVWQAEEVVNAGNTMRYYGFVGSHEFAKVPAEEIEFPGGQFWEQLASGLDIRAYLPGMEERYWPPPTFAPGQPIPLTVKLRNRRGMPQQVPALNSGIKLRVTYQPETDYRKLRYDADWTPVEINSPLRLTDTAPRLLAPTESFTAGHGNLADVLKLTQPGTYRVQLLFSGKENGLSGECPLEQFSLAIPGK
jgi:hypothetical protein